MKKSEEHAATSSLQEDIKQSVAVKTDLLGSNELVHADYVQQLHIATISAWMHSTNSDTFYRSLGSNSETNMLLISAKESVERFSEVTAHRFVFLLRLNDYEVSN